MSRRIIAPPIAAINGIMIASMPTGTVGAVVAAVVVAASITDIAAIVTCQ